jgi:hypothetical protein
MKIKPVLTCLAIGVAVLSAAGCEQFKSHHEDVGDQWSKGKDGKAPDCYKGSGSGPGQFGTWKFASDPQPAPASGAFGVLLGGVGSSASHIPDPNLLLGWGGGGGGGYNAKHSC